MKEPIPPCKGCKNRTAENPELGTKDCHKSCALYQQYKKDHFEWSKAIYKQKMDESTLDSVEKSRFAKWLKAKSKGLLK